MESDLLELEHVFGYSGKFQSTVQFHPTNNSIILYSIGALIVIEDMSDKHDQFFLRGHDNDVSALAVAQHGHLVASGQVGSELQKNKVAPVILWNFQERAPITQFQGLAGRILKVDFTADGGFLAALAEEGRLTVWDCRDGTVIFNRRVEFPVLTFAWGAVSDSGQGLPGAGRHPTYTLVNCYQGQVTINTFLFEIGSMSYRTSSVDCQMPSSGLKRQYTCAIVDSLGEQLFAGTHSGEILVYNLPNNVFRASVPLSSNGVLAIIEIAGAIYAGSGDGKVKKLVGRDSKWNLVGEAQLPGRVVSLSANRGGSEIICGTSLGCIFRLLPADLTNTLHAESPVGPVRDVSFGVRSDMFLVIDAAGFARIWDSSDYVVAFRSGPSQRCEGFSCSVGDDGSVLTGWKDGFIRCYDPDTSNLRWEIPNAHRGAVTALFINENYIISGGEDGITRLWARQSRQLLVQFADNRRAVVRVFGDVSQPNLIHSCGMDRILNSYDLKVERRVVRHEVGTGVLLDMSQRKDNELELVTCGPGTGILFWDCDEVNPVLHIRPESPVYSVDVSPSGKYVAAGSELGEVFVYALESTQCIAKGVGHSSRVNKLRWSPDGKQIVSVSEDCSIALWNFYV